jgi:D-alanyl-D-alanine dipeptidase
MTSPVGLPGMFAPVQGARDTKVNEDDTFASFAGMLAGVNQANAKLLVPTPQADGAGGDGLETSEESTTASEARKTDDSGDATSVTAASATDAATTNAATANATAVNNSVAAHNPALQEKLARVISRMREETGHDVQVTETYRSQSRQNALYAQGRQTNGPVVTWTQHSKHTEGRAVDVTLDGGHASSEAYTTLQRIANEEGLRTLGAKDPGHLELPSSSGVTVENVTTVGSGSTHAAKLSPTTYMRAIKQSDAAVAAPARVAQVANVAQVATVAAAASGSPAHATRSNTVNGRATVSGAKPANQQSTADAIKVADGDVVMPEIQDHDAFVASDALLAQADGAPVRGDAGVAVLAKIVAGGDVTIADATGASSDDNSKIAAGPTQTTGRHAHEAFEISNLDRLSDAVNATRVEDGSAKSSDVSNPSTRRLSPNAAAFLRTRMPPRAGALVGAHAVTPQSRAMQSQTANGAVQYSAATVGRSRNDNQSSNSNRQSSDSDTMSYNAMSVRGETPTVFTVADVSTDMTSTASQRAERIMAAQDAPARPLSQIVMSVDNGNGTSDRIQIGLRGSTLNATIDAADQHAANAMRTHSDELVRSLTRDGVDVESVRVRNTAPATSAAPVVTVDPSQKPQDSSSHSRFNREAQWDQQRGQQRSNNNERRQQQRQQRGGKES